MNKLQELHFKILNKIRCKLPDDAFEAAELTKTIAIEFSLWQQRGECRWVLNDEDEWMYNTDYSKRINTEELFNLFIEEKYGKTSV